MRFVARLAIATATLVGSAILCWGQQPTLPSARRPRASAPTLAAPASLQGTWVADDDEGGVPPGPPEQLGIPYNGPSQYDDGGYDAIGGYEGAAYGGGCDGNCGCDGSCGGECDGNCGCDGFGNGYDPYGKRHGHLLGCLFGPLWCSDLWNEVHAHRRVWVSADYLGFWTKGNPTPPLVTTSPIGTPQSQAGVLPESATTAILFGNTNYDDELRYGGRINVGYWLVDGEFWGVEGQYFGLNTATTTFDMFSNFSGGDPSAIILARPFVNVDPNLPGPVNDAALLAFPDPFTIAPGNVGTLDGGVNIRTTSNVQSANATLRKLMWIDFTMQRRVDLLLGYRFFRIDDSITINDDSLYTRSQGIIPDTQFVSQDIFSSKNLFNGGEIGLKGQANHGRLSIEGVAKCAFGNNHQYTYINGSNTITSGGISTTNAGGLLTQPSNIGTYKRDVFAILPEANLNLRWDITCNLRATAGYTFVYINRVQRSGSAIDLNVNPTQFNGGTLVGPADPAFVANDTTWYAHGFSGGVELRW